MAEKDQAKRRSPHQPDHWSGSEGDEGRWKVETVRPANDARHIDPHIRSVQAADMEELDELGDMLRQHFEPMLDQPVPDKLKDILKRNKPGGGRH